jgi:hypothetical protein
VTTSENTPARTSRVPEIHQGLQAGENRRDEGGTGERGGQREENRRDNPLVETELVMVDGAPASAEIDIDYPPAQSEPVQPAIPEEVLLDDPPIRHEMETQSATHRPERKGARNERA